MNTPKYFELGWNMMKLFTFSDSDIQSLFLFLVQKQAISAKERIVFQAALFFKRQHWTFRGCIICIIYMIMCMYIGPFLNSNETRQWLVIFLLVCDACYTCYRYVCCPPPRKKGEQQGIFTHWCLWCNDHRSKSTGLCFEFEGVETEYRIFCCWKT